MARFAQLNPFHMDPSWAIDVPGCAEVAHSAESVWQGLKQVDGRTNYSMFRRRATKRPPEAERVGGYRYEDSAFQLGGQTVALVDARFLIYVPAYLQVVDRHVDDAVLIEIGQALDDGQMVEFFDWDDNFDLDDPRSPFSHSALLSICFNGQVDELWSRGHDPRPEVPARGPPRHR